MNCSKNKDEQCEEDHNGNCYYCGNDLLGRSEKDELLNEMDAISGMKGDLCRRQVQIRKRLKEIEECIQKKK